MLTIPIEPAPSQVLKVVLNDQNCTIALYQKTTGVYCDLMIDDRVVWLGAVCQNNNPIFNYAYFGFLGQLAFTDTQGANDPVYTGFGDRFQLVYLSPEEAV